MSHFIAGRAAICRWQLGGFVISHITAALQSHTEPALERCLPSLWHLVLSTGCTWSKAQAAEHQSQAELLISPRQTRCNICNSRDIPRMMRRKEIGVSWDQNWNSIPRNSIQSLHPDTLGSSLWMSVLLDPSQWQTHMCICCPA